MRYGSTLNVKLNSVGLTTYGFGGIRDDFVVGPVAAS